MERKDFEDLKLQVGQTISLLDIQGNTIYGKYNGNYDSSIPAFNFIETEENTCVIIYLDDLQKIFTKETI